MQYGNCVVKPTPSAIGPLHFRGIAPSAMAALSKAQKAFMPSGALASKSFSLARFFISYISDLRVLVRSAATNTLDFCRTGENRANYSCSMLVKPFWCPTREARETQICGISQFGLSGISQELGHATVS